MYKPLSQEEIQRIKNEKKQKQNEKKQKVTENRKHLASVRVVQRNLVFVVGLSQRLADPEVRTPAAAIVSNVSQAFSNVILCLFHICNKRELPLIMMFKTHYCY